MFTLGECGSLKRAKQFRESQSSTYFAQLCSFWERGGLERTEIGVKKS